jgi:hypothetical protein
MSEIQEKRRKLDSLTSPSSPSPKASSGWLERPNIPLSYLSQTFQATLAVSDLQVENGIKHFDKSRRAFVFVGNSVEWLLSISPRGWTELHVAQPVPLSVLESKLFRRLNVICSPPNAWLAHSSRCDILIGADEGHELYSIINQLSLTIPALLICPSWALGTRKLRKFPSWSLHHQVVGGTTSCKGRMWSRGWTFTGLPRGLSVTSSTTASSQTCLADPAFDHLSQEDLLPILATHLLPIVFPTHATRTKWGVRDLTPKEIGLCLDAPQWIVSNPPLLRLFLNRHSEAGVIPLKMLQAPLQACLVAVDPPSAPIIKSLATSLEFSLEDPRGSWLPLLDTWLPPTWVDAVTVTAKAAKSDDADVHAALWDSMVSLVLGCHLPTFAQFRRLLFGRWCRQVGQSLRAYLRWIYGPNWSSQLRTERQRAVVSRQHLGGEEEETKGGTKAPLSALLRDTTAAEQVLTQVLGSDWWDWTCGSSLLFWRWDAVTQLEAARDGMEIFVQATLPTNMRPCLVLRTRTSSLF